MPERNSLRSAWRSDTMFDHKLSTSRNTSRNEA
jgi:hypothetical protein